MLIAFLKEKFASGDLLHNLARKNIKWKGTQNDDDVEMEVCMVNKCNVCMQSPICGAQLFQ